MDKIAVVGLDLAKNVFQLHAANAEGRVMQSKQLMTWSSKTGHSS